MKSGVSAADAVVESIFLPIEIDAPSLESADPMPACDAGEAIKRIAALYAVGKEARYKPAEGRVALRQEKAKPIFVDLEA